MSQHSFSTLSRAFCSSLDLLTAFHVLANMYRLYLHEGFLKCSEAINNFTAMLQQALFHVGSLSILQRAPSLQVAIRVRAWGQGHPVWKGVDMQLLM